MSETLVINTETGLFKQENYDVLPIVFEHHSILKQKLPEYTGILPSTPMDVFVDRLKATMKSYNGIGLSANQCGSMSRVFVIGTEHFQIACINPSIVEASKETAIAEESCLSFPGLKLKIERPVWIVAKYTNENGKEVVQRMEGLTARCFQHELDHMNGIKFTELVGPVALQMARKKQDKMMKTVIRRSKNDI